MFRYWSELKTLKEEGRTKTGNGNMEHDSTSRYFARRLSTDSGAPSSNVDVENLRDETELKRPLNQKQYKNFTKHKIKSGHVSDASSVTSFTHQTSDTEASINVMKEVNKIVGKRISRKGRHSSESSYVHIEKIVINNNPKPDNPYYFDPPPPPCAQNNYNYIKDDAKSVYHNFERNPIEQGSTPTHNSMESSEDNLHAMIDPYREAEDFVNGNRTATYKTPGRDIAGSIQMKNKDYGHFVKNPEVNIDNANESLGELEITLRTRGPNPVVWKGKLTQNSQRQKTLENAEATSENVVPQDTTTCPQHEPENPCTSEEQQVQHVQEENALTDVDAMQDNRVQAPTFIRNPANGLVQGNVPSARAVSAPDLVNAPPTTSVQNLQFRPGIQQQNNFNLSTSVPGMDTNTPFNYPYRTGSEYMMPQPQREKPKTERSLFLFSKSKEKQKHVCNIDGFRYSADMRVINRIREDLLECGKEAMWTLVEMKDQPTHPYSLLVKINAGVLTYPITEDKKGKFTIDNKQKKAFPCLCSLVQYYKTNMLPMVPSKLGHRYFRDPPSPVQYISPISSDSAESANTRL